MSHRPQPSGVGTLWFFENFDTARTDGRIGYLTGSTLYNDNDNDNDEFNKRRTNAIKKL